MPTRQGAFNEAAPQQATRHTPSLPGGARRLRGGEERRGIKIGAHSTLGLKGDPGGAPCVSTRSRDPQAGDGETQLNSKGSGRGGIRQSEVKLQANNGINPSMGAIRARIRARVRTRKPGRPSAIGPLARAVDGQARPGVGCVDRGAAGGAGRRGAERERAG